MVAEGLVRLFKGPAYVQNNIMASSAKGLAELAGNYTYTYTTIRHRDEGPTVA